MKKMQRRVLKFVVTAIALIFTGFHISNAQISNYRLKMADSLFQAKMYVQSFEHYREILNQNQYTPAMLLKMGYIQEGLGNIGQALYYLNLYYIATNDKSAADKMEELANKYNLEGYETTDTDRVMSFYRDHYFETTISLAALVIFFLSVSFYTRVRLHKRPVAGAIFMTFFVALLFVHLNFGASANTGIFSASRTYIMNGPSAGASVIEVTGDGHRVEILGKKDVWMKIKWNNDVGYVRNNSLLPVKL
jgi:hypothetical protein